MGECGGKTSLEGENSSSICCVTFFVYLLIVGLLGLMEPARDESCPLGQRRGRAAHGDDRVPLPGQMFSHVFTTPTKWAPRR